MDDMNRAMIEVHKESPLWKAWIAYSESESFRNTRRWAQDPHHVQGALWAAFHMGWIEGMKEKFQNEQAQVLQINTEKARGS